MPWMRRAGCEKDELSMIADEYFQETEAIPKSADVGDSSFQLWLGWERLRVPYNAFLFVVVCSFLAPGHKAPFSFTGLVEYAIAANVCFCAGPVAEMYARLIGFRGTWPRVVLFTLGSLFAVFLAVSVFIGLRFD